MFESIYPHTNFITANFLETPLAEIGAGVYLSILIAGFGGGVVRGLVGFIEHQFSYKNVKFQLPYFLA